MRQFLIALNKGGIEAAFCGFLTMKKLYLIFLIVFLTIGTYAQNPTGYLIEAHSSYNALVNWTKQDIEVIGYGALDLREDRPYFQAKLMAREAAKADAYRNLAETIKGVLVTSETTVENFVTESDYIRKRVDMFIQGANIVEEKELEGGGYAVKVRFSLSDSQDSNLSSLLLPEIQKKDKEILSSSIQFAQNVVDKPSFAKTKPDHLITGIVIDTHSLSVRPAMSPKIFSSDGKLIYGSSMVDPYRLQESTFVAYTRDIDTALLLDRVGDNPVVIQAIGVSGTNQSDIVISKADAEFLQQSNKASGFLEECRVVIVIE